MAEARALLQRLGALDAAGALTAHGRRMADIALPPRLAHMVLRAAAAGQGERAARIAALVVERGLGGRDVDLEPRLDGVQPRPQASAPATPASSRAAGPPKRAAPPAQPPLSDALLLAEAWPERIAKARGPAGHFQLASGRGVYHGARPSRWREGALAGGGRARRRRGPRPHPAGRRARPGRAEGRLRRSPDPRGAAGARRRRPAAGQGGRGARPAGARGAPIVDRPTRR